MSTTALRPGDRVERPPSLHGEIDRHVDRWHELRDHELRLACRSRRADVALGILTIVVAAATAVTVWPSAVATWVPAVLAAVTALVATARTVIDPAKTRTAHVEVACSLDWLAERLDRVGIDVDRGVMTEDDGWKKLDDLVAEGEKWLRRAEGGAA